MWLVCGRGEVFVGRSEGKRTFRKLRQRWKDNIKRIFKKYAEGRGRGPD
jgi:hypothetical protein